MPRRAPRQKPHKPDLHAAQPGNHCRAVVWVDGTAIREKIKQDYEKARRDLEKSRQILDKFHETDQPQFTRWLSNHLGALLTELRELHQKMAADGAIVFLVENEVMFGGGSHARAYQRVMDLRENPEPPPPPPHGRGAPDGQGGSFGAGSAWEDADDVDDDDPLKSIFDEMFGDLGPDNDPRAQRGFRPGHSAGKMPSSHLSLRLKELYRAVVRRLHPDSQREMTPQKTEWWHQAQSAYQAGDAEQLEVILTLCEIGESGTTAHTSASLLQRIAAQLKHSLRQLNRQISLLRRDPAWNFSRRSDHEIMFEKMRREMNDQLATMRRQWQDTQALIAKWKAAAEKLKRPRRRKSPASDPDCPF